MISSMMCLSLLLVASPTSSLVCYECNSDDNSTCATDWKASKEKQETDKEWEVTCSHPDMVCTKKIDLKKNGSFKVWRLCDEFRFLDCNKNKDSCIHHCKTDLCNSFLPGELPEAQANDAETIFSGTESKLSAKRLLTHLYYTLLVVNYIHIC
eukprot:GFUD01020414.1.p1 GENE.GFUD01020414.1~~GFUD01020414.1.p1  ORF type:complete len:153 (-),score=32.68 GFUD01020414.1:36-494(-)